MKKVMLVFGTRPEAIKMCPLVLELKTRENLETIVCVTGQHKEMLQQVLDVFGVTPDDDLEVMTESQTLFDVTEKVLGGMRGILEKTKPDVVLVHGDTTTTFATGLACFYLHIPVGHVEAGLRTYDIQSPWPEEFNRQAVDIVTDFLFAPTNDSRDNLIKEGKPSEKIYVTGNTEIDALKTTVRDWYSHAELDWAAGSRLVTMTAHRRESLGDPMRRVFTAIRRVVDEFPDVKLIYAVHLNPAVREVAWGVLGHHDRIHLIDPLGPLDFHNFLARSYLVLTDSGGIQEAAPSLRKPVLVLRDTPERPAGAAAGPPKPTGTDAQPAHKHPQKLLSDQAAYDAMSKASNPYGDGFASKRIADILEEKL